MESDCSSSVDVEGRVNSVVEVTRTSDSIMSSKLEIKGTRMNAVTESHNLESVRREKGVLV